MVKAKAAPSKLFKDPYPYLKNGFKVGMKLEGIDPEHPACFCVLTVAEVRGLYYMQEISYLYYN